MRQAACIIVALVCFTLSPVAAQQVIEDYGDPMTVYKPSTNTLGHGLRPTHRDRGVQLDGAGRAPVTVGARLAANPFRGVWSGTLQAGGVRLATGAWSPTEVDIALPTDGPAWVIGRSYNARQHNGTSYVDSEGYQGKNWMQQSQPEILLFEDTTDDKDIVYFYFGAAGFAEFKREDASSTEFKAKNGAAGAFQYSEGSGSEPDTYTLTDQNGNQFVFFGFDLDADPAEGQLWKIIDPEGNVSFAGHATTASQAITDGFDAGGRVDLAYDASDRRFTYTYDGNNRLTKVVAETKTGGTWASPTGVEEVAKVEYSYYADADTYGDDDDLKLVKYTTPLTDSGVEMVRKRYFRYWEGTFNASTNPGHPHAVKYVYDSEGLRNYDWDDLTFDEDFLVASNTTLDPYASAYFEYDSDHRIAKAWFNGECGCSGAGDGTYEFEYETNGSYTDDTGAYQNIWATRTIVKRPDGSYLTQYFDEVGQAFGQVVSDIDPDSVSPAPEFWATKVTRDASGLVSEVSTPGNVTSYTHSTATFTTSTSDGLVWEYSRETTGDMKGFLKTRKHKKGTSGTASLDEKLTYTSESVTIGDVTVVRPLISARRVYPTETTNEAHADSVETTYDYAEYTGELAIETVTTTNPAVSTSKNGSGSTTQTKVNYTKSGRLDYEKAADGTITYREYTNGKLTKVVRDADSSKTGFESSGTELEEETVYSYDAQGRLDQTTLPGGRVTKNYYSKLADGRSVHLSYPKYESGTPTFHGPVRYTVTNLAGKVEAQATVALSSNTTTSALTAHIDETDSDPILAADLGSVSALTTFIYGSTGTKLEEERLYYDIPASGAGADGTNYDPTLYAYDDSGRRWRTKHAHGTIYRTVYDLFGRQTERWMGKNDASFEDGEASGPDDMVKTQASEYDDGNDGGNGLLTERTLYVTDGTTDERVTEFEYDYRGRQLLVKNPTAPHTLNEYDNLGRMTATGQYSSHASISLPSDTPSSEATNRLALNKTFYDEMGRVWKRTRHKIDASDGSDDDNLESLTWFDEEGRVIKTDGQSLAKTFYDRVGRATHRFTLARDNDSGYSDADDVSGDIVMEESQTTYDDDGTVIMRAVVQRFHDDFGATPTTGALDTNADSDDLQYTAANLEGRIQITAMWYDDTGRLEDTVLYGTNGGSNFDRDALSVPTRSATKLRTTRVYHDSGQLKSVEDPREIVTYFEYDDAGRRTKEVRNYDASVNSGNPSGTDDNVTVKYEYKDGLRKKIIADLPSGTTDQETEYVYGTTAGTPAASLITTGHLLRAVVYPDSSHPDVSEDEILESDINTADGDVVSFAYNAQGQEVYKKDQAGNVLETVYDTSGRRTDLKATSIDSEFDNVVQMISTSYDDLGRRELITQYGDTSGSSIVDEVKFTYENWGNVSKFEQDINSAVGAGGSVDDYEVSYTYAKAGTIGRNTIRLDEFTLPSGNVITCKYRGNTTDRHDTYLSRVTTLDDGATVLVAYEYLGMGRVVGTDYFAADLESDVHGTTSGSYPDLDDFNRITTNKWTRDLATDVNFYEIDISYDENSNITLIEDNIHPGFDVNYTIDDLDRLTQAEEGTWGGSSITTTTREQEWTLDHVGNWEVGKLDLDGDGNYTGTDEWNDDRTHNDVNELTGRDTDDNGSDDFTLSYDENGNLTDDGEDYKYEWDPFGRLRKILDRGDDSLVAEYKYNGLNYRVSEHADTDDDGDVDSSDKWFHSADNERWQLLSVFREDDSDPKEECVHGRAGLDGSGSATHTDWIVVRDRDADTDWSNASDGVLEERIFCCSAANGSMLALVDLTSGFVEALSHRQYSMSFGFPSGDATSDGEVSVGDANQIQSWMDVSYYDARGDLDLDGTVDSSDKAACQGGNGLELAWAALSCRGNRRGYNGQPFRTLGASHALGRSRVWVPSKGIVAHRRGDPMLAGTGNLYLGVGMHDLQRIPPGIESSASAVSQVQSSSAIGGSASIASAAVAPGVLDATCDGCELETWDWYPLTQHIGALNCHLDVDWTRGTPTPGACTSNGALYQNGQSPCVTAQQWKGPFDVVVDTGCEYVHVEIAHTDYDVFAFGGFMQNWAEGVEGSSEGVVYANCGVHDPVQPPIIFVAAGGESDGLFAVGWKVYLMLLSAADCHPVF